MNKVCIAVFLCFLLGVAVGDSLTFLDKNEVSEMLGEIGAHPLSADLMSEVSLEDVINHVKTFEVEQAKERDAEEKSCVCHVFEAKKTVEGGLEALERGIPVWAKSETNFGCRLPAFSLETCSASSDCTCSSSRSTGKRQFSPSPTPSPSYDAIAPVFNTDNGLTDGEIAAIIIACCLFAILATVFIFALVTGAFAGGQVFTGTGPAMARDNPDA